MVAVTVAPGIGVLPDFTNPEIEQVCVAGASWASERREANSRKASMYRPMLDVLLELEDVVTFDSNALPRFICRTARHKTSSEVTNPLIH